MSVSAGGGYSGVPLPTNGAAASPNSVCCLTQLNVGPERFGKMIGALLEARRVIEENEVQPPQRLGDCAVFHARQTIGAKRLLSEAASTSFAQTRKRPHRD